MNKARVLVIDGDDWVARLLADGLREHGFDVSTCLSGGDALAVAATIEADCVITEMVLPELDGPSVARAIRSEKPPLGFVPILFLSNADDMVSRSAAFQAGADVYLTKPFRLDEVALQVRGLVAMSTRLTGSEKSRRLPPIAAAEIPESISPSVHAIEGNVAQMSVATVLTLLEMERRSGVLKVSEGKHKCELDIIAGYAVGGSDRCFPSHSFGRTAGDPSVERRTLSLHPRFGWSHSKQSSFHWRPVDRSRSPR